MVAINKILLPGCTGEGRGGGTRNPPLEARLCVCSPVHFLLSPSAGAAGPSAPVSHEGAKSTKSVRRSVGG